MSIDFDIARGATIESGERFFLNEYGHVVVRNKSKITWINRLWGQSRLTRSLAKITEYLEHRKDSFQHPADQENLERLQGHINGIKQSYLRRHWWVYRMLFGRNIEKQCAQLNTLIGDIVKKGPEDLHRDSELADAASIPSTTFDMDLYEKLSDEVHRKKYFEMWIDSLTSDDSSQCDKILQSLFSNADLSLEALSWIHEKGEEVCQRFYGKSIVQKQFQSHFFIVRDHEKLKRCFAYYLAYNEGATFSDGYEAGSCLKDDELQMVTKKARSPMALLGIICAKKYEGEDLKSNFLKVLESYEPKQIEEVDETNLAFLVKNLIPLRLEEPTIKEFLVAFKNKKDLFGKVRSQLNTDEFFVLVGLN